MCTAPCLIAFIKSIQYNLFAFSEIQKFYLNTHTHTHTHTHTEKNGLTGVIAVLLIIVVPAVVAMVTDPAGVDAHGGGVAGDQTFVPHTIYLKLRTVEICSQTGVWTNT